MNAPYLTNSDHRESSDRYRDEVFRAGAWRVVRCRQDLQWIIQAGTRAGSPDGARWEGRHYCATLEALLRLWRGETGDSGTVLVALLREPVGGLKHAG